MVHSIPYFPVTSLLDSYSFNYINMLNLAHSMTDLRILAFFIFFHVGKRRACAPWRLVWSGSESEGNILLHLFWHCQGEFTFITVWIEQILRQMDVIFLYYSALGIILQVICSSYYFLHWIFVWIWIFYL